MYICVCKAITDSQILTAIENGVCTRKKLTHCFGIGKDCGKCNKDVIALLEQGIASVQSQGSLPGFATTTRTFQHRSHLQNRSEIIALRVQTKKSVQSLPSANQPIIIT